MRLVLVDACQNFSTNTESELVGFAGSGSCIFSTEDCNGAGFWAGELFT